MYRMRLFTAEFVNWSIVQSGAKTRGLERAKPFQPLKLPSPPPQTQRSSATYELPEKIFACWHSRAGVAISRTLALLNSAGTNFINYLLKVKVRTEWGTFAASVAHQLKGFQLQEGFASLTLWPRSCVVNRPSFQPSTEMSHTGWFDRCTCVMCWIQGPTEKRRRACDIPHKGPQATARTLNIRPTLYALLCHRVNSMNESVPKTIINDTIFFS